MIGVLAYYSRERRRMARLPLLGTYHAAVLRALRTSAGRMLPRREIRRLCPSVPASELSALLNRLERAGHIVVDREERPVLYGVPHAQ